jgi:hypothetical protein
MPRYMKVEVDGKEEEREIVGYETNRDLAMNDLGLEAFNAPLTTAYPIPQMNEGEHMERVVGGKVIITTLLKR